MAGCMHNPNPLTAKGKIITVTHLFVYPVYWLL